MAEVTTPIITDTTGQSIASAISGLGATLGSDKANISGDNIASPATFRTNIGASKVSVTEYTVTGTTNAQGYLATSYDFNNYLLSIRATDITNIGLYAIARPSLQGKVVVMCINDLLQGFASQDVVVKLRYLTVT